MEIFQSIYVGWITFKIGGAFDIEHLKLLDIKKLFTWNNHCIIESENLALSPRERIS